MNVSNPSGNAAASTTWIATCVLTTDGVGGVTVEAGAANVASAEIVADNTVGGTNKIRVHWTTNAPHVPYCVTGHVGGAANGPFHNGLLYVGEISAAGYVDVYPNDGAFIDPAAAVVRVHLAAASAI